MIKKNWEKVLLILIIAVGAYLRLWRISEYMTFLGDEGRDVLIVRKMITEGDITFLGPTASVGGFFLGPIYYYFMTPFLWLWNFNPVGPAIMVALFGIATIYLVYKTGSEFFNRNTGLFAASLYALSPLVIAHSRSSWNPNIVPFFSLLLIYSLWKGVILKNKSWFVITGICLGVGLQLHYLFIFLIPVVIAYLLLYQRGIAYWKNYLFTLFGIIIPLFPFLAFEIKNKLPNTNTIIRFIFEEGDVAFTFGNAIHILSDVIFRLFARLVFFFPPPEQLLNFPSKTILWWKTAVIISIFASVVILIRQIYLKKDKAHVLLIIWFIFGAGLFAFYQRSIFDYYFGIMFALPFLLVGNTLSILYNKHRILKLAALLSFISLLVLNWNGRPFKHSPNNQFEQVRKISKLVFDEANNKPLNFALITGGNSDHAYRYFLDLWGNPSITIENFQKDPHRKTVTDQLLVVCETRPCQPLGHPLWEIAGFGEAQIDGEWEISFVKVYRLIPYEK